MPDPYETLGVSRQADEAEIKKAFRRLAKKHHPDRNADDAGAKDRFAQLNQAYEILGDPEKRKSFDRGEIDGEGKPRFQGFEGFARARRPSGANAGAAGFESFSFGTDGPFAGRGGAASDDVFSQIFGGAYRAERARSRGPGASATRGEDVSATLTVTLEEAAAQAKRRVQLPTGRDVEVTLPRGVADGQVIRLRGVGHSGMFGSAEAGDALLTIRLAPHEHFTVEGQDLRHRLPLPIEDAVLGARLRVPTLTGAVEMAIPPMTSSGRTFRLRGKGLPGKDGAGDLLVTTEIRLPEAADEALLAYAKARRGVKV